VGKQLVAELNRVTLADLIVRDEPLLVQLDSSAR
jgi:hypothetical protein